MYLKPYRPLKKPKTDLLTYIIRFVFGCVFGLIMLAVVGFSRRINPLGAQYGDELRGLLLKGTIPESPELFLYMLGIVCFFGVISSLFGDKFWGMFGQNFP